MDLGVPHLCFMSLLKETTPKSKNKPNLKKDWQIELNSPVKNMTSG